MNYFTIPYTPFPGSIAGALRFGETVIAVIFNDQNSHRNAGVVAGGGLRLRLDEKTINTF